MLKSMTRLAEELGFHFALSPVKYRGWGGPTEFADYVLESFEVMAALAEATDRIRLYGSVALPTVHFPEGLRTFGERVLSLIHTVKPAPTATPTGTSLHVELPPLA
jgi:hypothetical protein